MEKSQKSVIKKSNKSQKEVREQSSKVTNKLDKSQVKVTDVLTKSRLLLDLRSQVIVKLGSHRLDHMTVKQIYFFKKKAGPCQHHLEIS